MAMTRVQKIAAAAAAAALLASPFEGRKFTPYYDPPGILTVCDGHTGADVVKNQTYTPAQCDKFMTDDMRHAVTAVEVCAPGAPQSVLIAFGDAVYNMGPTIACNTSRSTAARFLKTRQWADACRQLPRWAGARIAGVMVTLQGLLRRRNAEMTICLNGLP